MKKPQKEKHNLEWFQKRIGHKVYRNNGDCQCESCTKVYKYGIVIDDIIQARVLFDAQNELGLFYFDKDIQFPNIQLFRKRYEPNGGKNSGYSYDKIWNGYKMTLQNENEIINWSKEKITRCDEVDYMNGKDIYWLITITNEWYDVVQSRLSIRKRVQKIPLNDYVIKGLPSGWILSDKDDYTIVENKYLKPFLQELKIK
jgi:hypothetical protein